MSNKNKYYKAFTENNGMLNEIALGEKLGLDETETREIISQLLSEYKIEYFENKACNYSLMKSNYRLTKKNSR